MTRVFVPGSFDPPTLGHFDVFTKCMSTFDEVVIGIGVNPKKTPMFSPEQRIDMIRYYLRAVSDYEPSIIAYEGLTVKEAKRHDCDLIVRGVREVTDFIEEMRIAQINIRMENIPTVFMPAEPEYGATSSSTVKELFAMGGNWEYYVSTNVAQAMRGMING